MTALFAHVLRQLLKGPQRFAAWLLRYVTTTVTVATSALLLTMIVVPAALTVGVDWLGIPTAAQGESDLLFVSWIATWLAAGTGYLFHEILERKWTRLLYLTALFAVLLFLSAPSPSGWQAVRMGVAIGALPLGAALVAVVRRQYFETDRFRRWWTDDAPAWLRMAIALPRGLMFASCCVVFAPVLCELLPGLPPHLQSPLGIRSQLMAAAGL